MISNQAMICDDIKSKICAKTKVQKKMRSKLIETAEMTLPDQGS